MVALAQQEQINKLKRIKREKFKKDYLGYIYLAPFLILFFLFTLLPVFISLCLSVFNFNGLELPKFIGLDNYKFLFFDDDIFPIALKNTFVFAIFIGPIGYFASFFMAIILNKLRFRNVFALAFYAPSITSGIAMTVVWMYIFANDRYGLINNFMLRVGVIDSPILWNQDPKYIFPIVILISVWMSMGTGFLVFLAGLQSLSKEIFEQGRVDGISNPFEEIIYLTIPMMKPQLLFGAITAIVGSFGIFDVAMQFAGFPSPNYSAHTLVAHAYDYAFTRFQFGYSSAISVILFAITFILGRICLRIFRTND